MVVVGIGKMKDKYIKQDLGMAEDMANMLKQLVCAEDHLASNSSLDSKWMETLDSIRQIRTKWLSTIVKEGEGTLWCISKHLLASSEGLIEVGNRFFQTRQKKEAEEAFKDAQIIMYLILELNELEKDVSTKTSA